jgi:hypothetical protein
MPASVIPLRLPLGDYSSRRPGSADGGTMTLIALRQCQWQRDGAHGVVAVPLAVRADGRSAHRVVA